MDEPERSESSGNYADGDDPIVPPTHVLPADHQHHSHQTTQNENIGDNKRPHVLQFMNMNRLRTGMRNRTERYIRFERIGWDRAAEIVFAGVIVLFSFLQYESSQATSRQIQTMIDATNQMKTAAWTFSGAAQGINNAGWNAVGKLDEQSRKMDVARKSAEGSANAQLTQLQTQEQMAERPLILLTKVDDFRMVKTNGSFTTHPGEAQIGDAIGFRIYYANTGRSPALSIQVNRHVTFGDRAVDEIQSDPVDQSPGSDSEPGSPALYISAVTRIDDRKPTEDLYFVDQTKLRPWDGSFPIALYGEIIYHDRFRNTYCTPFIYLKMEKVHEIVSPGSYSRTGEEKTRTANDLCPKGSIR